MIKSGMKDSESIIKNTYLEVILDDGEEFIESIEKAFKDNNIKRATLESANGVLKNIKLSTTTSGKMRQREYIQDCKIRSVSGQFYKKDDDYFGDVHISIEKDPLHQVVGLLLEGYAVGEVRIRFKINNNIGLNNKNHKSKNMTLVKQKILEEDKAKPKKPIMVA
jgi:predicted DNA-binding protein with PD1-like motif